MRTRSISSLLRSTTGAVAPTVALSLFALIGAGGIAFDYARLATLDTELQQAADQAALAAATQLDGGLNARARAAAAARQIVSNSGLFANNGQDRDLDVATVAFCSAYDDDLPNDPADPPDAPTGCTVATGDADAAVVVVTMGARQAYYALTPIVGAISSGNLTAQAAAHVGSAICKVPPVMICNPSEPVGNVNEMLDFDPARGTGLRLVTGSASAPGNFGWLEAGLGNGTPALAGELGYNVPKGPCQAVTGVTTKTGMDTAVLAAFNTRFDVYANGNTTCPNQGGGTCSPSVNTRKDLTCEKDNSGTACKNNTPWNALASPYDPYWDSDGDGDFELAALPTDGSRDPKIMGYPHDLCHSSLQSRHTCGIVGSAVWDVNAYFRVNYGWTETQWRAQLPGMSGNSKIPARWDVYQWEISNPNGSGTKGINFPQYLPSPSKDAAFSIPATGRAGVAQSATQPDRRTIAVAVLNCRALNAHGKTTDAPVPSWLKVFLVEPAFKRGSGSDLYSDTKDIYVEFIEKSTAQTDEFEAVVRRDVPYLVK
jgi:Flp pilus assembly protein TadG